MPKIGIKEHEIVKISKKGELETIFAPFFGLYTKKNSLKFVIYTLYENLLEPNLWLIAKEK